jgi:MYXO-CTERM domain-containing protein
MKKQIPSISIVACCLITASHAAVIYEPFDDNDASLRDNATGTGLTGSWRGDSRPDVEAATGTMSFGSLTSSGNQVSADASWFANNASIDMTNTAYTDLLAHGGEMWFSMLYRIDTTSTGRFYFTIGSDGLVNNGNLSAGQAIGFGSTGTRVYAGLWESTAWGTNNLSGPGATSVDVSGDSLVNGADGGVIAAQTTYLIVGHAQWGATALDNDTVTLYLPGTDLSLGTEVARSIGVVDQSTFDLINTNHGNNLQSTWDEIRVGADYASVSPIPEPSAALLGGLGALLLLRRRRDA